MVIVACVALSIMISNNLVIPLLLRYRRTAMEETSDAARHVLLIRRAAIVAVMLLAYAYYRMTGGTAALASIGLLSFAALAQFAPAFFGGLVWRGATARGAIAGMVAGFAVWGYTLLLPAFVQSGLLPDGILENGPFGLAFLRPQSLFGLSDHPLAHGVFWSLAINAIAFVGVSLSRRPEPIERLQANIFVPQDLGQAPGVPLVADDGDGRRPDGDGGALCRRRAGRARLPPLCGGAAHRRSSRTGRPTSTSCASPSSCSPRRSAPPRRGSCCRS